MASKKAKISMAKSLSRKTLSNTRHPSLATLRKIRLIATDVDGVLTDGGMYYSDSGQQIKKFNVWDGMGLALLGRAGLIVGIITTEKTKLVAERAKKLQITEVHQGIWDKLGVLEEMGQRYGVTLNEMAFIGDDINDVEALKGVGFSASPANARPEIQKIVHYVCKAKGGEGAVRELADLILSAQSKSGLPQMRKISSKKVSL
ncbi:HAD-IIIA family hydrolase [Candidatus Nitronereus thalassa]|uniref:HAD-IIIA family hydrolase n=1 Tax=Candidatus Nitronereus thalassa TaxID=3020898 RepID=A0ABU3K4C3_9BACT|nr:HAD-IIIA family hydrolase [Candidatus Nitronereus thalassa]MDT7041265.1 HAD-IIIA family hydrolase [Candidatus Nitronereus thalassa]